MGQLPGVCQQLNIHLPPASDGRHVMPDSYFRSRLYTTPFAVNPLLAAALPIFSLLDRLALSTTLPSLEQLREDFNYELRAFHSRVLEHSDTNANHSIAYYLLTATIDELIAKNYLRIYEKVDSFQAFCPLSHDTDVPGEQFFRIVDAINQHPSQYLDVIEIAYFCLNAGYEGIYHDSVNGKQQLDDISETLYQIIHQNRGYQKTTAQKTHQTNDQPSPRKWRFPLALMIGISAFAITLYFCHSLLNHKIASLTTGNQPITQSGETIT